MVVRNALSFLVFSSFALGQSAPPRLATLELDGKPLTGPRATLDPWGRLRLRGDDGGEPRAWDVQFPFLSMPDAGSHGIGGDGDTYAVREKRAGGDVALRGTLVVKALTPDGVAGQVLFGPDEARHELRFDLQPVMARLRPPTATGVRQPPTPLAVDDRPNPRDLVFCAVGNTGSGLPGASRVASQIARLAKTGPLDFVLLLGNTFMPAGVESIRDPQWQSKFEQLFDPQLLGGVLFYPVLGACDRSSITAIRDYAVFNVRWTFPQYVHHFETESHGKKFRFIAVDTKALSGDIANPVNRVTVRVAVNAAAVEADWKIVFGHHAMYSSGETHDQKIAEEMRRRVNPWLTKYGVDLFISAGDHSMELYEPGNGVLHVMSGAGGGPEMATGLRCGEETIFGCTGGGFTWFRFDGEKLEISLRDADGKVLFVHHVRKG